jgi:hypothetical protein
MTVAEMLQRMGSAEVGDWIAELSLRAREEKEALDAAKTGGSPQVLGG